MGEAVEASVVIVLVVVTAYYVVFTQRLSGAAMDEAKASRELAAITRKQFERAYYAEYVAVIIDELAMRVSTTRDAFRTGRLGWFDSTARPQTHDAPELAELFIIRGRNSGQGHHTYLFPYAYDVKPLPGELTEVGHKRLMDVDEQIRTELNDFNGEIGAWRQALANLAIDVAATLNNLWQRLGISREVSLGEVLNWDMRPFVAYVAFRTLVRVDEKLDELPQSLVNPRPNGLDEAIQTYHRYEKEITEDLSTAEVKRSTRSVQRLVVGLDARLTHIESTLEATRRKLTREYQLDEHFIIEVKRRDSRRGEQEILV